MLSWSSFAGKLVQTIIEKLVGKSVESSLDKKSRAAKAFYHLYESIDLLIPTMNSLIKVFEECVTPKYRPIVFSMRIQQVMPNVNESTETFLNSFNEVAFALAIYDPDTTALLMDISRFKFYHYSRTLNRIKDVSKIEINARAKRSLESIKYSHTKDEAATRIIEKLRSLTEQSNLPMKERKSAVTELMREFELSIVNVNMTSLDFKKLELIHQHLDKHLSVLEQTKSSLQKYIANSFSIEDLLFSKSIL